MGSSEGIIGLDGMIRQDEKLRWDDWTGWDDQMGWDDWTNWIRLITLEEDFKVKNNVQIFLQDILWLLGYNRFKPYGDCRAGTFCVLLPCQHK